MTGGSAILSAFFSQHSICGPIYATSAIGNSLLGLRIRNCPDFLFFSFSLAALPNLHPDSADQKHRGKDGFSHRSDKSFKSLLFVRVKKIPYTFSFSEPLAA